MINYQTVVNIPLLDNEMRLLSRGISFCPKPSRIDKFQLKDDFRQLLRRLRLWEYFYDPDNTENHPIYPFKNKSKWTPPPNREPALETYLKSVKEEIYQTLDQGPKCRSRNNITSQERKTLISLRKGFDIVIKPANKGPTMVVMSTEEYLTKVINHLNNKKFNKKVDKNLLNDIRRK